jgi:hypothetical protein
MKAERDRTNPRVVYLVPERGLERATRRFLLERTDRCAKCGSGFVTHEPLFVHCHYCGAMVRVAAASLIDQELFEIRSGLRLAS